MAQLFFSSRGINFRHLFRFVVRAHILEHPFGYGNEVWPKHYRM